MGKAILGHDMRKLTSLYEQKMARSGNGSGLDWATVDSCDP